ncbi:hypothetical protein UVI_02040440 [Ustilaginoidea virens]|uniref:Exoribonuclease phosphorolytic domain-containing protein n=1 Tax=Ustilaginoidea virens TaxID=1159556 RepID=A0A1B5KYJ7_USTVR|nr:hypothetical protein UVI_02040440 [Ustilaginoidea virens]
MTASSEPLAELSPLPKADGSASFSHAGYVVTAAVNGPIEAPRRDENPFEALVDVVVRPSAGVGAAIPLKTVAAAAAVAVSARSKDLIVDPSPDEADKAGSVHVMAFTSNQELLLAESSGSFSVQDWDKVLETGRQICCQAQTSGPDTAMTGAELASPSIKAFIRSVMGKSSAADFQRK